MDDFTQTNNSNATKPARSNGRHDRFIGSAIIVAALGMLVASVVSNRFVHSPNDGSRWDTVWNLVHRGTYQIDGGPWGDRPVVFQREKDGRSHSEPHIEGPFITIDMVRRTFEGPGGTEEYHYYSSKPPILPTLAAGLYYVLWQASETLDGPGEGARIAYIDGDATGDTSRRLDVERGEPMGRVLLLLINGVPFLVFLHLYRRMLDGSSYGTATKVFCLVFAAFGTYLTAYCRTFNNHTLGAFFGFFAVCCALRVWYVGDRRWDVFAGAGLFAGFAATCELPATALLAALLFYVFVASPGRTLAFFIPGAAIPIGLYLVTNYLAMGDVIPAQARFNATDEAYRQLYHYEGSYWSHAVGIDAADEPKWLYVTHMLVGHHGLFTLTPVLLLSIIGIIQHLAARDRALRSFHLLVLLVSAALFAFLILKTNNYGGGAQGLRWSFWLIPLWLIGLPRGVDAFLRHSGTAAIAYLLLGVSVFSTFYALFPPSGPWSQSWWHAMLETWGLANY